MGRLRLYNAAWAEKVNIGFVDAGSSPLRIATGTAAADIRGVGLSADVDGAGARAAVAVEGGHEVRNWAVDNVWVRGKGDFADIHGRQLISVAPDASILGWSDSSTTTPIAHDNEGNTYTYATDDEHYGFFLAKHDVLVERLWLNDSQSIPRSCIPWILLSGDVVYLVSNLSGSPKKTVWQYTTDGDALDTFYIGHPLQGDSWFRSVAMGPGGYFHCAAQDSDAYWHLWIHKEYPQNGSIAWVRDWDGAAWSLAVDQDACVYLSYTTSGSEYHLAKLGSDGSTVWDVQLDHWVNYLAMHENGDPVGFGAVENDEPLAPAQSHVTRFAPDGSVVWETGIDMHLWSCYESGNPNQIATDWKGNTYVVPVFLRKLDPDGNVLWRSDELAQDFYAFSVAAAQVPYVST